EDLRFGDNDPGRHKEATTEVLVLAPGCPFTNELVLRPKNSGIPLCRMVEEAFTTNRCETGFTDHPPNPAGRRRVNPPPYPLFATRGHITASLVMFRKGNIQVNFEDAAIPPMAAAYVRAAIDVAVQASGSANALLGELSAMWKLAFQDFSESPDPRVPEN